MSWLKQNKNIILIFLLICTLPGVASLFHPGFFVTDDGTWMIIRFSAFYEALRSGQFPVRYVLQLNNGFGYPVVNFLYPLYLYLAVPFHILKFSFVNSIKIILGLSIGFSGIFSYLWLKKRFSNFSSFMGSLVYLYFPYHLWDIYKRGSTGEVLALAIVPYIFWQIEKRNTILTGFGIGLLILSHNILALLFLPVIAAYMILTKRLDFKNTTLSMITGFGLSIFFWLPALLEKNFTVFNTTNISQPGKYFIDNQLSLVGVIGLIALVFGIALIFKRLRRENIFFLFLAFISIFFASSISQEFWRLNIFVSYIQFPFRFLSLSILSSAFLTAAYIDQLSKKQKFLISSFVIIIVIFSCLRFLTPQTFVNYPDGYYSTNRATTTVENEYMPIWVKTTPDVLISQKIFSNKNSTILDKNITDRKISFNIQNSRPSLITVGIIDYPGWVAFIDNNIAEITHNNTSGLIQIKVPGGKHSVYIVFTETPIRLISDLISLLTLVTCGILFIVRRLKVESA